MGTHPIFESDFDCLTDLKLVENGQGTTKVERRKGKSRRRRWKKVQKEVVQRKIPGQNPTYDKVLKEVPNYKVITPSIVSDRMKIRGSLARRAIKELHVMGKIKLLVQHSSQMVYTRAIAVDDDAEEAEAAAAAEAAKAAKKQKKAKKGAE